jgi:hypothetical protein
LHDEGNFLYSVVFHITKSPIQIFSDFLDGTSNVLLAEYEGVDHLPTSITTTSSATTTKQIDSQTGKCNNFYLGLVKQPDGTNAGFCYDSHWLILINNEKAGDVTYSELLTFLKSDNTDTYTYQNRTLTTTTYYGNAEDMVDLNRIKRIIDGNTQPLEPQICEDFAERLHNNAEKAGIRCAYVSIDLSHFPSHALCAFQTTDRGLIYVDDTGTIPPKPSNCDKTVNLSIGQEYIPQSLFPEPGWQSTWENLGTITNIFITWDGNWNN